jgi:hypothetical protein
LTPGISKKNNCPYFFLKIETVPEITPSAPRTTRAERGDFWVGKSGGFAVGERSEVGKGEGVNSGVVETDATVTSALMSGGTRVLSSA